ncbi:hypothetical protein Sango_0639900 [Sesamum angolense]|uniref:Uncharacterized protein n=1 Tax=Sesamum angolense TaxID=2727404 RepID=A0AAE1X7U5_9LAMI|nr:hypothetical protein Sango_0639900 [Sesamum angolense]
MRGDALGCFKWMHANGLLSTWPAFVHDLELRFELSSYENHRQALFKSAKRVLSWIFSAIGFAKLLESKLQDHPFVFPLASPILGSARRPVAPVAAIHLAAVPSLAPTLVAPRPSLPIKRLSPAEMQARRVTGLCFNCDERFVPGHRCKSKQFFLLLADDEVEPECPSSLAPCW